MGSSTDTLVAISIAMSIVVSVDIMIDTRRIFGGCVDRYLVDTRSTYNRYNAQLSSESRPLVLIAIMAVGCRLTIGRISVNCRPMWDKLYGTSIGILANMSVTN